MPIQKNNMNALGSGTENTENLLMLEVQKATKNLENKFLTIMEENVSAVEKKYMNFFLFTTSTVEVENIDFLSHMDISPDGLETIIIPMGFVFCAITAIKPSVIMDIAHTKQNKTYYPPKVGTSPNNVAVLRPITISGGFGSFLSRLAS